MPAVSFDRQKEFPQDGRLWWVRWIDQVRLPHRGTSSPSIDVFLSPLAVDQRALVTASPTELVADARPGVCVPLLAGAVPRLGLGSVFLDGRHVSDLRLETDDFVFRAAENRDPVRLVGDPIEKSRYPRSVLAGSEYPLGTALLGSKCVVLVNERGSLVLPAFEVFRSFLATDSEVAHALMAGPWRMTWPRLADPDRTLIRSDGSWQVHLRRRVSLEQAPLLALLIHSKRGHAVASAVHSHITRGPGLLHADIPFEWTELKLTVQYVRFSPRKCLGMRVVGIRWPDLGVRIKWSSDWSNAQGAVVRPSSLPRPYASMLERVTWSDDDVLDVTSNEDPRRRAVSVRLPVNAPKLENLPPLDELEKEESTAYAGAAFRGSTPPPSSASAGTEGGTGEIGACAHYGDGIEQRGPSRRFSELTEMLSDLQGRGIIQEWKPLPPLQSILAHGPYSVWPFPGRRRTVKGRTEKYAWAFIDPVREQRRGALVCEIRCPNVTIYWIEVELRSTESGIKALLLAVDDDQPDAVIRRVLRICASRRGVWPADTELEGLPSVAVAVTWRHTYLRREHRGLPHVRTLDAENAATLLLGAASKASLAGKAGEGAK